MKMFIYNGVNVRMVDFRPRQNRIQLNAYNPADAGKSIVNSITPNEDTPTNIDEAYQSLVDSGEVGNLVDSAIIAFNL